jgi:GT2 family glycosyltransferase
MARNRRRLQGAKEASVSVMEGIASSPGIRGFVELYGYDTLAAGWFFSGWTNQFASLHDQLAGVAALFGDERIEDHAATLLFEREDVSEGLGFIVFLRAASPSRLNFSSLTLDLGGSEQIIPPTANAAHVPQSKLIAQLGYIMSLAADSEARRAMELLLNGAPDRSGQGYFEYYGHNGSAAGWIVSGWMSRPWLYGQRPEKLVLCFEEGDVYGESVETLFSRVELADGAEGVVLFLAAPSAALGPLRAVRLSVCGVRTTLIPTHAAPQLRANELIGRVRANLAQAEPSLARDRLLNLIARKPYCGEDTLDALSPAIFLYVDEAVQCGLDSLVISGWTLAKPGGVKAIRLRSGGRTTLLNLDDCVRIERHDVLADFAKFGFEDAACGFMVFVPNALTAGSPLYVEVETDAYQTAFRNIPNTVRGGITAMKRLLGAVDLKFDQMRHAFDNVLGPAVEALNEIRLAAPVTSRVIDYGELPAAPRFSVIVPLYGRLDYVEYQMAMFSAWPGSSGIEFIYVLDDPPLRREAQALFSSIHQRFLIPFRAVLLERNVGFAPANNAGLAHARGEYVAYVNSDVFPGTSDWLERLAARLAADPALGVIGPLLLFEDGSVQHRGMFFERLPEYGDWFFCQHYDKGHRYTSGGDVQKFISITGACMVLRRDLAVRLGGFDEIYAIGDFEDSDLCLKVQALGLACAVDPSVHLYHLERKSQSSGALTWRTNLTAYNAWQHERRWADTISERQDAWQGGQQ